MTAVFVPEGYVLVPAEPTREMWAAMGDAVVGYKQRHHDKVTEDIWSAGLKAAPPPPQGTTPVLSDRVAELEAALSGLIDASPDLIVRAIRKPGDEVGLEAWTAAIKTARAALTGGV